MDEVTIIEKIGEYKKEMRKYVKGLVRSKMFANDGTLAIEISKSYDKANNERIVTLTATNGGFTATMNFQVATRVYNKVEPTLFDALKDQLGRAKNAVKLIVK